MKTVQDLTKDTPMNPDPEVTGIIIRHRRQTDLLRQINIKKNPEEKLKKLEDSVNY